MKKLRKIYVAKLMLLPWMIGAASYASNALAVSSTAPQTAAATCHLSEPIFDKVTLGGSYSKTVAMIGCSTAPVKITNLATLTKTDLTVVGAGVNLGSNQLMYWDDTTGKSRLWLLFGPTGKVIGKHYKKHNLADSYCAPGNDSAYDILLESRKGLSVPGATLQQIVGCSGRQIYKSEFLTNFKTQINTYIWGDLSLKDRALLVRTATRKDLYGYPAGKVGQPYVLAIKDVRPANQASACTPTNTEAKQILNVTDINQLKKTFGCAPLLASDYVGDVSNTGTVVTEIQPTLVYGSLQSPVFTVSLTNKGFNSQFAPLAEDAQTGCSSMTFKVYTGIRDHLKSSMKGVYDNNKLMKSLVSNCPDTYFAGSSFADGALVSETTAVGGSKSGWIFKAQHLGNSYRYTTFENLKAKLTTCRPSRSDFTNFSNTFGVGKPYSDVVSALGCDAVPAYFAQGRSLVGGFEGQAIMMWRGANGDNIPATFNFNDYEFEYEAGDWNYSRIYSDEALKKDFPSIYKLWIK